VGGLDERDRLGLFRHRAVRVSGVERQATPAGDDEAVRSMCAHVEDELLVLALESERLYFGPIRAGWSRSIPSQRLTADEVRDAPLEHRAAVLRHVRRQRRATERTAEAILYDFAFNNEPPAIDVEMRRRVRGDAWTPEGEALLVGIIWSALGPAGNQLDLFGSRKQASYPKSSSRTKGEHGLLKKAAEMYNILSGGSLEAETLRNRYNSALRRNRYARGMVTFSKVMVEKTWLTPREARWLTRHFFVFYHDHLRSKPPAAYPVFGTAIEKLHDKIELLARRRPESVQRRWQVAYPAAKYMGAFGSPCDSGFTPKLDGRRLSETALEALRERAVAMLEAGHSQLAVAAALGVHSNTVSRWHQAWHRAGEAAFKAKRRGRRPQQMSLLSPSQADEAQKLIIASCPDQHDLPFALWERAAVRDLIRALIRACFGVTLAIRTVGDYLRRWGFTPQRPIKRALVGHLT